MNARPRSLVHPVSGAAYQVIPGISLRDRMRAAKAIRDDGSISVGASGFPKLLAGELDRFDSELAGLGIAGSAPALVARNLAELANGIRDDAKGVGESLAEAVAESLGAFVEGVDLSQSKVQDVINEHIATLQLVAAGELSGDGGKERERLLGLLTRAIRKVSQGR